MSWLICYFSWEELIRKPIPVLVRCSSPFPLYFLAV
jgi:hypothetical protein